MYPVSILFALIPLIRWRDGFLTCAHDDLQMGYFSVSYYHSPSFSTTYHHSPNLAMNPFLTPMVLLLFFSRTQMCGFPQAWKEAVILAVTLTGCHHQ